MSTTPETLSYAGPTRSTCPLCRQRPADRSKRIYGHPVCKKCLYAFANRRQLAYLLDSVIYMVPAFPIGMAIAFGLARAGITEPLLTALTGVIGLPIACLFAMKDGFGGQSPGKRAADVQVIDEPTGQPIGFKQSFKRNAILLVGQIPFVGGIVALVVLIALAMAVGKGYRWGDRYAKTKVIWKKYAGSFVFGGASLVCEQCGYDLQGNTSGICPECGTAVSEANLARLGGAAVAVSAG